ncbi:DUF4270 family protein [Algivirga pacifica]|uniref:DUF4270 domain-containing protein n=1 Tax=Algivirga pacifica TaxID=1162670 RepID=A0ABP9D918_9BACT
MNSRFLGVLGVFLAGNIFFSCNDGTENNLIGQDIDPSDSSFVNTFFVDSFAVAATTEQYAAPVSGNVAQMPLGAVSEGTLLGKTNTSIFAGSTIYGTDSTNLNQNSMITSVTLTLPLGGYLYGDTLQTLTFSIFENLEPLKRYEDEDEEEAFQYYTTDRLKGDQLSILTSAEVSFDDTLQVDLPLAFGERLKEDILRVVEAGDTLNTFDAIFDGISIVVDERQAAWIAGINMQPGEPSIRLSFNDQVTFDKDTSFTEQIYFGSAFYNVDYEKGEELSTLTETEGVSSIELANRSIIVEGTGIGTRIDFPSLLGLSELGEGKKVVINKAELFIPAIAAEGMTIDPQTMTPIVSGFTLFRSIDGAPEMSEEGSLLPLASAFPNDGFQLTYNTNIQTFGSVNLTTYLQDRLERLEKGDPLEDNGLILLPTSVIESVQVGRVNKAIIGDSANPNSHPLFDETLGMRLEIFYTIFD